MNLHRNKRGSSYVTNEMWMKVGEIIIPILAFLTVFYIVQHVGSSRGPQTYYQTVEYSNIIDSLSTFTGIASLRYVPIMPDFKMNISNSQLAINTLDDSAPSSRFIHVPTSLVFANNLNTVIANPTQKIGQVRFTKTNTNLTLDTFETSNIQIPLGPLSRPKIYNCGPTLNLAKKPMYLDTNTDLANHVTQKNIATTTTKTSAGLIFSISAKESSFNSIVIFSDGSSTSNTFACAFANSLKTVDPTETQSSASSSNIDSVILVPQENVPFTQAQWGEPKDIPKIFIELSYKADILTQNADALHNPILAKAIADAYAQVYS